MLTDLVNYVNESSILDKIAKKEYNYKLVVKIGD